MIDPSILSQKIKEVTGFEYVPRDVLALQTLFKNHISWVQQNLSTSIVLYKDNSLVSDGLKKSIESPPVYSILGIDGSQIYPDRHRGSLYFLVRAAVTCFIYKEIVSQARFVSDCFVFNGLYERVVVDQLREYHEFEYVLQQTKALVTNDQCYILCDGRYLQDNRVTVIEEKIFDVHQKYQALVSWAVEHNTIVTHYTSVPASRDLMGDLLNMPSLSDGDRGVLAGLDDGSWLQYCLQPGQITDWFIKKSEQQDFLEFVFCYWHNGYEIVRIDLPKILFDQFDDAKLLAVLADQVAKGFGYPVCLTYAHEQAVVRAADEQVFFAMVSAYAQQQGFRVTSSLKAQKKLMLGV
jgi:hypothetical protein